MKNKVQQFGKFLSGMVMPNIGALIAFGFLAALFIDTGWIPNEKLNSMVSPMLTYLIPILIASTGGKMVGGDRGRVVGAIAVIGAIMSDTSITMLMAAMIIGPLGGFCIKKFDEAMDGHMPAGFEMLINNFSAGIIGMLLAILGYVACDSGIHRCRSGHERNSGSACCRRQYSCCTWSVAVGSYFY